MLTEAEFIEGTIILIWVIIAILIGIRILLSSLKQTRKYIYISFFWLLSSSPYFPMILNYFIHMFSDAQLPLEIHLGLNILVIWWGNFFWFAQFTEFFSKEKQKLILGLLALGIIFYEIITVVQLVMNPLFVGNVTGLYNVELTLLHIIANMIGLMSLLITGLYFSYYIFKLEGRTNKFRGISLLVAFVTFFFGVGFDAGFIAPKSLFTLILSKFLLLVMGILFYLGFFPPKKLEE
jgi:hypothetical protein